ncbi:hypothetical protein [Leeuwenhoekiella aestuarii]|uniref:Uncharacterized protein n=1 Tax=Leeuwenhoekiella aestuarii TaxID=2249426 RepID=A0A4Q0NSZ3_9FLAO|nr:hypothetical protein [Leeuwenhoekiella aestuarii]RXG13257.1 hypothetical protein DSM04_105235 [Leeuwenhoekiella aestuarii]
MDNKQYVFELATVLHRAKATLPASELANVLNEFNHLTTYGSQYSGGRGTYKLISDTYAWLVKNGNQNGADIVAIAFTKPDGSYAYEK